MSSTLIVRAREQRESHSVTRWVSFQAAAGPVEMFFEMSGDVLPPPVELHDFAVLAALVTAMREGRPIHVEGPVTEALIRNLEEFQETWALWRPKYQPVRITADQILPAKPAQPRRGVFAFSGGVDGTFSLLRHHKARAGLRTARPACAMLVHGFDIPLDQPQAFERARQSGALMLETLGLSLTTVRTNWRNTVCKDWPMEFAIGLAACLHQFHGLANIGVLGADEDYGHLELPWSSNPITNHFLSGGSFQIHTEGGGFTRTARVRMICDYPEIAAKLRVCWQGPQTGANCGRCEKCIRTKLNFLANKQPPLCFDDALTHAQILGIRAQNPLQIAYLREIRSSARKNGIKAPWVSALTAAIAKNRVMLPARALRRRVADKLRPLLRRPAVARNAPQLLA